MRPSRAAAPAARPPPPRYRTRSPRPLSRRRLLPTRRPRPTWRALTGRRTLTSRRTTPPTASALRRGRRRGRRRDRRGHRHGGRGRAGGLTPAADESHEQMGSLRRLPSRAAHSSFPVAENAVIRVRVDLAYDGTDFSGWATQPGQRTVQGELSEVLGHVLRLPEPVRLTVAGRTDSGVHARGQVAHADLPLAGVGRARRGRTAAAGAGAAAGHPGARDRARPRGLRRPLRGAVATVRLPDLRSPGRRRSAAQARHALEPPPARPGGHERGRVAAARRA